MFLFVLLLHSLILYIYVYSLFFQLLKKKCFEVKIIWIKNKKEIAEDKMLSICAMFSNSM